MYMYIQLGHLKFLHFSESIMEPNLMFKNALKIGKFSIMYKKKNRYQCNHSIIRPLYKVGLITLFHKHVHVAWIMALKDGPVVFITPHLPAVHSPLSGAQSRLSRLTAPIEASDNCLTEWLICVVQWVIWFETGYWGLMVRCNSHNTGANASIVDFIHNLKQMYSLT